MQKEKPPIDLDRDKGHMMLFPIEKTTHKLTMRFGDQPGALARAAALLAKNKVNLIYSSSRSLNLGKEAEWEVIADFSGSDIGKLEKELRAEKGIKHFSFSGLGK